jgi:hypothetical protein
MPRRQYAGLSPSSESGDPDADPFAEQSDQEFIVLTALSCSDVDEPSPSLYRKEKAVEDAYESFDEKSEMEYKEGP